MAENATPKKSNGKSDKKAKEPIPGLASLEEMTSQLKEAMATGNYNTVKMPEFPQEPPRDNTLDKLLTLVSKAAASPFARAIDDEIKDYFVVRQRMKDLRLLWSRANKKQRRRILEEAQILKLTAPF